jgi:hypothetical protein
MTNWKFKCLGQAQRKAADGSWERYESDACGILKPGRYGTDPEENPFEGYCFRATSWEYHQLYGLGVRTLYLFKDDELFAKSEWNKMVSDVQRITPIRTSPPDIIYMVNIVLPNSFRMLA